MNPDEVPMRRELMRQIGRLERQTGEFVAANCPYEPIATHPTRGPALLSTAELEQVRDELVATLGHLRQRQFERERRGWPPGW